MARGSDRRFQQSCRAARLHCNIAERYTNVGTRMTLISCSLNSSKFFNYYSLLLFIIPLVVKIPVVQTKVDNHAVE